MSDPRRAAARNLLRRRPFKAHCGPNGMTNWMKKFPPDTLAVLLEEAVDLLAEIEKQAEPTQPMQPLKLFITLAEQRM